MEPNSNINVKKNDFVQSICQIDFSIYNNNYDSVVSSIVDPDGITAAKIYDTLESVLDGPIDRRFGMTQSTFY